jgi:hypothetical protein
MEIVLLASRLILALVLGVAGVAKLFDPNGSRKALVEFGVADRAAMVLSRLLPVVELIAAVALIPRSSAWFGGLGALVLMLVFCVGIGVKLARGEAPACHCFGQLHSEPISSVTLGRNLALTVLAGVVVAFGRNDAGLSAVDWLSRLSTGEIINLGTGVTGLALITVAIVLMRRTLADQANLATRVREIQRSLDEEFDLVPVERIMIPLRWGIADRRTGPEVQSDGCRWK